jgi:DNA-binding SARP family transcriptional activator/TolB-like protein
VILLRTLGELRLEGGSVSLAGRRRELTLAAFLARRAPRPCHRAELASLLWETRDDARARQSLRQALLELKRVLGDALRIESDQVTLDPAGLSLDVTLFLRALDDGREADAAALWQGDFLAGMDDVGGEAFRAWLEAERESLRQRMLAGFGALVERAAGAGDWRLAASWAERWVEVFPFEENGTRQLARMRDRLGRKGRAPRSAALFSPDMVGRGPALAELDQAWSAACAGEAVLVVVEGEPGAGKTRLLREFLQAVVERGDPPVILRIPDDAIVADGPLTSARALFGALALAPGISGASAPALAGLGQLLPAIATRFPAKVPPAPLAEALADALAALAVDRPLVLRLDDADLMDGATQALLAAVTPRLTSRILVLLTSRGDAEHSPVLRAVHAAPTLRRLRLPPLSARDIEALLASMLELAAGDRHTLAARLLADGGGNPFYVVELTLALVDEGLLTTDPEGGWRLSTGEEWSMPLPSSLRAAIVRRLERLPPESLRVAEAAAILGRRCNRTALGLVAGLGPGTLEQALEVLIAGRLMRGTSGEGHDLEFRHDLITHCAYEGIPLARRRQLHRAAATALASLAPEIPGARAAAAVHRRLGRSGRQFWSWGMAIAALLALAWLGLTRGTATPSAGGARVVVASFENQTGDSTLNAAGQLLADWITQSIAQSEIVPVVDTRTALTSERIVGADTGAHGAARLRALATEAGASRVVWGAYYRKGDSLMVQASISDAGSGLVLRALDPVGVLPRDPSLAVERVSQGVLGALALLYNAHGNDLLAGVKHPPSFAAYRAFMDGMDLLVRYQSDEAAAQFARAHVMDSTFTQALVWQADAFEQLGQWARADSVLRLAARSREQLGGYEQVFLDYRRAELAGDFARALDQARELARIAPGSEATFLLAAMAIRLNRPREALRALAQVDPDKGFLRGWDGFWGYPMQAHLMLGELDQALASAREGRQRYPDSRQAVHQEVTVLSALGREAEVNRLLEVEDGLPESPGLPLARTMRGAATMLRAFGFDSASRRLAERAIQLVPNRDTSSAGDENRLILVEALYLLGRYADARPIVATMAQRVPGDMTWEGYTGLLAARLGERAEADSIMRSLAADRRPFAFGRGALWRARIEAALGQDQQAISLLRTGLAQGLNFDQAYINMMPDFRELQQYADYRELFRPKG